MNPGSYLADLQTNISWMPGWAVALFLFLSVLGVGLTLQYFVMKVLARVFEQGPPLRRALFMRAKNILRFALFIFAIGIAAPLIPLPFGTMEVVHNILVASFIVLLGWIILVAVNAVADSYVARLKLDESDNLLARKASTQVRILMRAADALIVLVTIGLALMNFQAVRQFGISIFASAGIAGIIVGLAARPMLENLFAGIQLAITQPIRVDDAVVVENEWGWVEEFSSTYVVVRLWDRRRMILPLSYFLQKPFQNWTRTSASLIGSVLIYLDYAAPVEAIRAKATEIVKQSKLWDGDVVNVQITDVKEETIEIRILVSAKNSSETWDLRCEVREKILAYIKSELSTALPKRRTLVQNPATASA